MTAQSDQDLFLGGPPLGLQRWLRLEVPPKLRVIRRAVIVALVGWLPLLLLTAVGEHGGAAGNLQSFAGNVGVHARALVAAPVLVLAEGVCLPQLGAIARHFLSAGFVVEADRERYGAAVASTRRLLNGPLAEILVAACAYGVVLLILSSTSPSSYRQWLRGDDGHLLSPAGWWAALVSTPLLLMLVFGWLWRILLWTRFLALMARLNLALTPSHPDQAAGLKFVGYSVRAFGTVAFGLSAVVAGRVADEMLRSGPEPTTPKLIAAAVTLGIAVVLFVGPLCAFTLMLLRQWRRGVFGYGGLASEHGRRFERRWLAPLPADDDAMLGAPDFSSTTDLYQVAANVYAVRYVPVEKSSIFLLAVTTLAPFTPAVLMAVPLPELLGWLKNLLL